MTRNMIGRDGFDGDALFEGELRHSMRLSARRAGGGIEPRLLISEIGPFRPQ